MLIFVSITLLNITDTKFYLDRLYYWKVKWVVSTVGKNTQEVALSLVFKSDRTSSSSPVRPSVRQIFKKHSTITVTNTHLTHHTFPLMTHPLLNHCYKHTPNTSPSCHTLCHTLCSITVGTYHTSYTSSPAAITSAQSLLQTHILHFHPCCHTHFSVTVTNTPLTLPPLLPHPLLNH